MSPVGGDRSVLHHCSGVQFKVEQQVQEGGSRHPRKIPALLTKGKEQKQPLHSKIYGPQQAGKNPVNISANPASIRSYRVIGVSPYQTCSCCLS